MACCILQTLCSLKNALWNNTQSKQATNSPLKYSKLTKREHKHLLMASRPPSSPMPIRLGSSGAENDGAAATPDAPAGGGRDGAAGERPAPSAFDHISAASAASSKSKKRPRTGALGSEVASSHDSRLPRASSRGTAPTGDTADADDQWDPTFGLEERLKRLTRTGETLVMDPSRYAGAEYTRLIINPVDSATHICLLCRNTEGKKSARRNFSDKSNISKHLNSHSARLKNCFTGSLQQRTLSFASRSGSVGAREAALRRSTKGLPTIDAEARDSIEFELAMFTMNKLQPYSTVASSDLFMVVQKCLLMHPCRMENMMSRSTLNNKLDCINGCICNDIADELLDTAAQIGCGFAFLQLDGVATKKGDCTPVLLSWLDDNFQERNATFGVCFHIGKGAQDAAKAVAGLFDQYDFLSRFLTYEKTGRHCKSKPFKYMKRWLEERWQYEEEQKESPLTDEEKSSAIACYIIGSATADGAILKFNEELQDSKNATTHHCDAHRMSLMSRFACGQKEHGSIWPPEKNARSLMTEFNRLVLAIATYFEPIQKHNLLKQMMKEFLKEGRYSGKEPFRMHKPTETRFLSQLDLYERITDNLVLFQVWTTSRPPEEVPDELLAFFEQQVVYDKDGNFVGSFKPSQELELLVPVFKRIRKLILLAETPNTDVFQFQTTVSEWLLWLRSGQSREELNANDNDDAADEDANDSDDAADEDTDDDDDDAADEDADDNNDAADEEPEVEVTENSPTRIADRGSKLVRGLTESLRWSTSYYFDRNITTDWGMLICLVLHPYCSGVKSGMEFPGFHGRFKDLWERASARKGDWKRPKAGKMHNALRCATEKILKEELEQQYDIDHGEVDIPGDKQTPATLSNSGLSGRNALKRKDVTSSQTKSDAVNTELSYWLNRTPQDADFYTTMREFWEKQEPRLLRRVAQRAGGFKISQCEVERTNKDAKRVIIDSRLSTTDAHAARDVHSYSNRERAPSSATLRKYEMQLKKARQATSDETAEKKGDETLGSEDSDGDLGNVRNKKAKK